MASACGCKGGNCTGLHDSGTRGGRLPAAGAAVRLLHASGHRSWSPPLPLLQLLLLALLALLGLLALLLLLLLVLCWW